MYIYAAKREAHSTVFDLTEIDLKSGATTVLETNEKIELFDSAGYMNLELGFIPDLNQKHYLY